MKKNQKINQKTRRIAVITLVSLIIIWAVNLPLPRLVYEYPGGVISCQSMISKKAHHDQYKGDFFLTFVSVRNPTIVDWIYAHFADFVDISSDQEVYGPNNSVDHDQLMKVYLKSSENKAIYQAYKLANLNPKLTFSGVYVESIAKNSDFVGKISAGDLITKINGRSFAKLADLLTFIKDKKVGERIKVSFLHRGKSKEVTGKLIKMQGDKASGIGINLIENYLVFNPQKIKIKAQDLGGPSGGLMFTLSAYQLLVNHDLTKGRKIAGTGTIEFDGSIGRIGGIEKKVVAANKAGMKIFLAPEDIIPAGMREVDPKIKTNYQEALQAAKKIKTKMKIVPVKTVAEAVDYLERN
jgi:PDZ domain-containing protein